VPFYLAGGLKIVYDLLLYRDFRSHAGPAAAEQSRAPTPGEPPAAA
jgi:hypothetical protein